MSLTLPAAQLLALLLGSLLQGTFVTLFVFLVLLLVHSTSPCHAHRNVLIPVAWLMMVLSTAHLVLGFARAIQAFTGELSPNNYYEDFSHPLQTAKTCVFIAQTLLGDGMMIWRCYVVYNHSKIILLLSLLPLGFNLIFGALAVKHYGSQPIGLLRVNRLWLSTYMVTTLVVNALCSAAVVYKIYRTSSGTQTFSQAFPIIGAVIKSGSLYVTSILALLISYFVKSNGVYPAIDVVVPLVGIVFSLMVLQIYIHLSYCSRSGLNFERTETLPTLGTLPRWRHYFSNTTEQQQFQGENMTDPRILLQPAPVYSRDDTNIDRVSLTSDADTRFKEGNRVQKI